MFLGALRVLHVSKRAALEADPATTQALLEPLFPGAFRLDTCQRTLWVFPSFLAASASATSVIPGAELFSGSQAYRFLLEVSTGLQSEVQGETDIFGQLKEAWAKFEASKSALFRVMNPWILRLFEDTKEIRALHLQNLGGASYGSLVRRILKAYVHGPQEPVLMIGAGQIAASIAPWLADQELWLWNRSPKALDELLAEVRAKVPGARVRVLATAEEEAEGFAKAAQLVVCIPVDAQGDAHRVEAWLEGNAAMGVSRPVVHLGGLRAQCRGWEKISEFHGLDAIFALQRVQDDARTAQIARAFRACAQKAMLRGLSGSAAGSATLPHGWEDLAVFA